MPELIQVEPVQAGIQVVTLCRPERRNALSIDLMQQLCAAITRLADDPGGRVVILKGAGPVFCAGLDLQEATDSARVEESAERVRGTLQLLGQTPLIAICALHGGAFGGGAGLMAACDIVVAADDARVGFPEAQRGLLPALIAGVLRPKVQDGDLRELFLAGESIDVRRAQQIGLVQRIVPAAELLPACLSIARSVLKGGPDTVRATKKLLNDLNAAASAATAAHLAAVHLEARRSAEAREGMAAFLEKRPPQWIATNE